MSLEIMFDIVAMLNYNEHILDGVLNNVPYYKTADGSVHMLDVDTLKYTIVGECAELELLYPDPDFLKQMVEYWAKSRAHSWQRVCDALFADYSAIENYDRYEEGDITHHKAKSVYKEENNTLINRKEETKPSLDNDNNQVPAKTTHSVSGYDGNNLVTDSEDVVFNPAMTTTAGYDKENGITVNNGIDHGATSTDKHLHYSEQEAQLDENGKLIGDKDIHNLRIHGNIGVTKNQDMIEAELELRKNDIYKFIANDFKDRFCLLIY